MSPHAGWSGDDDDLTLTVPLPVAVSALRARREEGTDIVVNPAFAVDPITEELPLPALLEHCPPAAPVAEYREAFPRVDQVPFSPTPVQPRSHSALPPPRAAFDSDTSIRTWKKTQPALRRMMVGVPVVPGWAPEHDAGPATPRANTASTTRAGWSPLVMVSLAVCLVAMVVMTIVGFGSRAAEATRLAHTRIVSATGPDGAAVLTGRVFVDGSAECESTPCELELTTGTHWITVRAPGYETPPSRSIQAGVEEPTDVAFQLVPTSDAPAAAPPPLAAAAAQAPAALAAALPPVAEPPAAEPSLPAPAPGRGIGSFAAPARLNINSVPAANVVLDGRPIGRTPLMGVKVKPGSHSVVFIGPGGKRASRSTLVGAGRTATVAARL